MSSSRPLRKMCFNYYQASSTVSVLGWPGDADWYLMHRIQLGTCRYKIDLYTTHTCTCIDGPVWWQESARWTQRHRETAGGENHLHISFTAHDTMAPQTVRLGPLCGNTYLPLLLHPLPTHTQTDTHTCTVICHTQSTNWRKIGALWSSLWFRSPWPTRYRTEIHLYS